jgi:D-galactose 1-dehydrogenase
MNSIRLAIVGFGKIAHDQHIAAIAETEGVTFAAVADPNATFEGVPHFATLEELLERASDIDAVALCAPPQVRRAQAAAALRYGKHVLLEKPPGTTMGELAPLIAAAQSGDRTLFAAWHSRFAPAVEPARAFLVGRKIHAITIIWKEDVHVWHPAQNWILEPGGFGVFDPGINALSILTRILPRPVFVTKAELAFPANRYAPVAAELELADESGLSIRAAFDFFQTGPQTWDIRIETDAGLLVLSSGGARLFHDGQVLVDQAEAEYAGVYKRFIELIRTRTSDVDLAPLQLVSDAFLLGRRSVVEPFEERRTTCSALAGSRLVRETFGHLPSGEPVLGAALVGVLGEGGIRPS